MPRAKWHATLHEAGFNGVTYLPVDETQFQQALILAQAESAAPGHWLIFTDESGVGADLAEKLTSLNQTCTIVQRGPKFRVDEQCYTVNPAAPADFKQLLAEVTEKVRVPLQGVIDLWPLDTQRPMANASLEPDQALSLGSGVYLVQALVSSQIEPPRLWFVTRSAQAVNGTQSIEVEQSPVWGLGKVVQLEHPELRCTRIDLDGAADLQAQTSALFAEVWRPDAEDQIALRNEQRYAARLARTHIDLQTTETSGAQSPLRLQASGNGILEDLRWQPFDAPER